VAIRSLMLSAMMALGLALVAPQSNAAEITLKGGHINQPNSPLGLGFQKFADLVKEKSNGVIEVQVFPASQLGPIDAQFENLTAGSQDIMIELLEWYGRWDKRFSVFGLPYLFRDRAHMQKFLASDMFKKEMIGSLEEKLNAKFLTDRITWNFMLDRTLLCKRPVFQPSDLDGLKLRMFQSRIPVLSWETLGAKVQILPWAETYTALATGTVDCITARVEAHYNMKQTEVAKYITVTKEFFQVYVPLIGKKALAKLSPAQVKLIEDAAYEAGEWFTQYGIDQMDAYKAKVKDEHGVSILEVPLGPWQAKMKPAYKTFEKEGEIPSGMIEYISKL